MALGAVFDECLECNVPKYLLCFAVTVKHTIGRRSKRCLPLCKAAWTVRLADFVIATSKTCSRAAITLVALQLGALYVLKPTIIEGSAHLACGARVLCVLACVRACNTLWVLAENMGLVGGR